MLIILILIHIKIIHFVFCMEHDEIQFLFTLIQRAIVDHIGSLEIELNEGQIESNEFKAEFIHCDETGLRVNSHKE